jgi:FAD binding domain
VTSRTTAIVANFGSMIIDPGALAPLGEVFVAPATSEDAVEVIRVCATDRLTVRTVGSGSTIDPSVTPRTDVVVSTSRLTGVTAYEPDDLTLVVTAGTRLSEIEDLLAARRQTAVLPEPCGTRTIGGVVAGGDSGYRRLRYGPTRDRVLGITLVTGYGEVVSGGGRLVKNVTGFDLPRLVTGSHGALGVVTEVCVKLWPEPHVRATAPIEDPHRIIETVHRPSAVLETEAGSFVYLEGSMASVTELVGLLDRPVTEGHRWPDPIDDPCRVSVRVPPRSIDGAVAALGRAGASRYIAQHGVGRVDAGFETVRRRDVDDLRRSIADVGGIVEVTAWNGVPSPQRWTTEPDAAAVQRRMLELFDPASILDATMLGTGL